MNVTMPEDEHVARAAAMLDRALEGLPKNKELLTDYQKWQRFQARPEMAQALPPRERVRFYEEMARLGARYQNQGGH